MGSPRHPVLAAAFVLVMTAASGAQVSAGSSSTAVADVVAAPAVDTAATATAVAQRVASPRTIAIQQVINYALAQLGKGYAFNTAGPTTFDCSGLTKAAYAVI